ncbi:hypothetical protein H4R18_002935 [Coemansia javaensis]|uniref:Pet127-domain-containing protein n=1 Tax=Coemansia javaensis TaxID=2761396 RepID=A0A9W8H8F1_9FUNG|nr:hypothetical protein H4R18_002935 [Coemansia javaensis]
MVARLPAAPRWDLARRLYSSEGSSSSADTDRAAAAEEEAAATAAAGEAPRVVDNAPVYPESEAGAARPGAGARKSRPGARTERIHERDPVVVHDLTYPLQSGKWYRIDPEGVGFKQVGKSHVGRVPRLAHGLERVLFSPGVHCLQDPNSGVYNFDPYIRDITQPADFDYDKLTPYITSSRDAVLMQHARARKKQFVGSTSSMTHVLSHLYFAISGGKQPDISSLSMAFSDMPTRFTRSMRYPASIALRYQDGVYGIDADKSFDVKDSILSVLGKSLEKVLTSTPAEFEKYKKQNSYKVKEVPEENYHYVEVDDFVLRSQLDCRDDRLPRRTFDLKTRGSLAVRMDIQNYNVTKGYQINAMKGRLQSFEREYYDMIRSAFLKYNFQVRIGNMDGIFVAYHNTARMFGFQYISRREMDAVLYGNELTGSRAFRAILALLGKLLRTATDQYPQTDLRVTFDSANPQRGLEIWVEVINDKEEAIAAQRYQETGQFTTADLVPDAGVDAEVDSEVDAEASGGDPFAGGDPLGPGQIGGDGLPEVEIDPADEIYINTAQPILKYRMETFSTLNDQDTTDQVTLRDKGDKWFVNCSLQRVAESPEATAAKYRRLRLHQATYFERATPDTPDEDLSPMVRILRRISRKNMWRNEAPKGKVVVNRSRLPKHTAEPGAPPARQGQAPSGGGGGGAGSRRSRKAGRGRKTKTPAEPSD